MALRAEVAAVNKFWTRFLTLNTAMDLPAWFFYMLTAVDASFAGGREKLHLNFSENLVFGDLIPIAIGLIGQLIPAALLNQEIEDAPKKLVFRSSEMCHHAAWVISVDPPGLLLGGLVRVSPAKLRVSLASALDPSLFTFSKAQALKAVVD